MQSQKAKRVGLFVAGVVLPAAATVAWAQPAGPGAGTPGAASPWDAFSTIFGVDPSSIASMFASTNGSILASVSTLLNTAALTAVVATLLLTGVGSALDASRRGETRWSIPWWIIRTVTALFFVVPTASGYSPLQGTVMWVAYQGSELSDQAWAASTQFMASSLSVVPLTPSANTHGLVKSMFKSAVCAERLSVMAASVDSAGGDTPEYGSVVRSGAGTSASDMITTTQEDVPPGIFHRLWSRATGAGPAHGERRTTTTINYDGIATDGYGATGVKAPSVCGSFSFTEAFPDQYGTAASMMRKPVIEGLVKDVGQVAHDMVTNPNASTADLRKSLAEAEARYATKMQDVARQQVRLLTGHEFGSDSTTPNLRALMHQLDTSLEGGWFAAGAYYMTIARISDAVAAQASVESVATPPATETLASRQNEDLAPWMHRAGDVFRHSDQSATAVYDATNEKLGIPGAGGSSPAHASAGDDGPGWFSDIISKAKQYITEGFSAITDYMPKRLAEGRDPVVVLQEVGSTGLDAVEAAYLGIAALSHYSDTVRKAWPVIGLILLPTFLAFAALAWYLPAMPFILWIFGILGWLLMLIEAVAIAPFWGASHALPEGEGFAGQHARQGYMLVLSLIARPMLMIFGLLAGMVLLRFAVPMLSQIMFFWKSSVWGGATVGIGSTIFLIVFYAGMMLATVRFSFGLIHQVPDRALSWIGARVAPLGESENEQYSRHYTMAAVGVFGGMGRAGRGAVDHLALGGKRKQSQNMISGR